MIHPSPASPTSAPISNSSPRKQKGKEAESSTSVSIPYLKAAPASASARKKGEDAATGVKRHVAIQCSNPSVAVLFINAWQNGAPQAYEGVVAMLRGI
jgi:hypothetical protein